MGAALLILGLATLTPLAAQAAGSGGSGGPGGSGGKVPLGPPQASGQDAKIPAGLRADGDGVADARASATSPSSTKGPASGTLPVSALPSGVPSADPALTPTDLGALPQSQSALGGLRAQAEAKGSVRVIVTLDMTFTAIGALTTSDAKSQRATVVSLSDKVSALAVAQGATITHTYGGNIPVVALSATPAALDALAASDAVAKIDPDLVFTATDTATTELIGAADAQERGYHGAGTVVAVMDTGVEYGHSAFGGRVTNAGCFASPNACPNGASSQVGGAAGVPCTFAPNDCSHGTHVAGIATGAGSVPGVADSARVEAVQVFHQESCNGSPCARSSFSDITAGLNFVYNDRAIGTVSVNISIGGGLYTSNCDAEFAAMKTAVDNLRSVNIATAISSGNDYSTNSVSAPGCISTAITVGATNNSDAVADFSNSSAQVDLYAPGVSVQSSVPGNTYGYKSGTSMAAPHVAGSIATIKSIYGSGLTVAQEESMLGSTGVTVTDSKSGLTRQRINVLQAAGVETITLVNDGVRDLRNPIPNDHRFATNLDRGYWSATAVRPPAGADYDLSLYDNPGLSGYLGGSSAGSNLIDFVAVDNNGGRRPYPDVVYPLVRKYSGTGRYQIEFANDATTIGDATYSVTMGSSEVIEIRDSYQTAGVPTYYRVVPGNGSQDPELFVLQSTAGTASTYIQGRSSAVAGSSSGGAGQAEAVSSTSPASQFNGLVLTNRSGSGTYTLYRDTSAPTGSVSIDGGAASTTDQTVDLAISAADGQTNIQDMRISVDGTLDTEPYEAFSAAKTVVVPAGAGTKTVQVQLRNNAGMATTVSDTIDLVAGSVPGAPTVTGTTPVARGVSVAFSAPASDGGSAITGYTVQCASTDGGVTKSLTRSASPITVNGLSLGKAYHCRVRATNAIGTGAFSAYGATVTVPATAPGAPAVTGSTPGVRRVTVAFSAPASDGGSAITGYTVQCASTDGGVTRTLGGTTSPIVVGNLTSGNSYHCRARATNAVGSGPYGAYGGTVLVS